MGDPKINDLFFKSCGSALWPTQTAFQWLTRTLPEGVKRPGREGDHSPPTSVEIENKWSYKSTPPPSIMACIGMGDPNRKNPKFWSIFLTLEYPVGWKEKHITGLARQNSNVRARHNSLYPSCNVLDTIFAYFYEHNALLSTEAFDAVFLSPAPRVAVFRRHEWRSSCRGSPRSSIATRIQSS